MGSRNPHDDIRNSRPDMKRPVERRAPQQQTRVMPPQAQSKYQKASQKPVQPQGYRPVDPRQHFNPGQQEMNSGFVSAASQMNGVNGFSRNGAQYKAKKGMGTGAKVALGFLIVLLIAVVGFGVAMAQYVSSINENLGGGKSEEEQMVIKEQLAPVKTFDEPFYMLLIGSDARSDGSVAGERSDTNILCRIDPNKNLVTMVSIPRDTMIEIDGYGTNKFNAAYSFGGTAGVIHEASELMGVEISHYAEVNFDSLIELVDVVGGVEVDVPELINDPDAGEFVIEPGVQVLDGPHALEFARCRSYADGDFTRTSNQRLLIEALAQKVLSMPVTEMPKVIKEASKSVSTDMSVKDIVALATQFKNSGDLTIYSAMVPSTTAMVNGISYVVCDQVGLSSMMKIVEEGGDPNTTVITSGSAIGSYLSDTPYGAVPGTENSSNQTM